MDILSAFLTLWWIFDVVLVLNLNKLLKKTAKLSAIKTPCDVIVMYLSNTIGTVSRIQRTPI